MRAMITDTIDGDTIDRGRQPPTFGTLVGQVQHVRPPSRDVRAARSQDTDRGDIRQYEQYEQYNIFHIVALSHYEPYNQPTDRTAAGNSKSREDGGTSVNTATKRTRTTGRRTFDGSHIRRTAIRNGINGSHT